MGTPPFLKKGLCRDPGQHGTSTRLSLPQGDTLRRGRLCSMKAGTGLGLRSFQ